MYRAAHNGAGMRNAFASKAPPALRIARLSRDDRPLREGN